jgi:hypothetical protein
MTSSKGEVIASRRAAFQAGLRMTLPFMLSSIPFAIIFGVLATGAGLSVWETCALSLFSLSAPDHRGLAVVAGAGRGDLGGDIHPQSSSRALRGNAGSISGTWPRLALVLSAF